MTLPPPRIDMRSFQDIVDEAKRLIPRYAPEWTDHNLSDPGVALIELFAWMTESIIYRLNQVPEIDSAIRMIVSTAHGERVMRPDFGCGIWDLLFEPVNPGSLGEMEQAVTEAVQRWEPRVEVASVVAEPDSESPERVNINIEYAIRATNDQRNLVFPFYVIPQEGEE